MCDTPNLDELKELNQRLSALLSDPHPSLASWLTALSDILNAMNAFHPSLFSSDHWAFVSRHTDRVVYKDMHSNLTVTLWNHALMLSDTVLHPQFLNTAPSLQSIGRKCFGDDWGNP